MKTLSKILDPKCNNFTLLRLLSAIAVVVSHAVFLRTGDKADEIFAGSSLYTLGDHAVNVFFILSGLTVAASLARSDSTLQFLVARALRIFPALLVCTITLVLVGMMLSDRGTARYLFDPAIYKYVAVTASLTTASAELPGVFSANPHPTIVNASLWTLKFEVLCYIGLALLGHVGFLNRQKFSSLLLATWIPVGAFLILQDAKVLNSVEQAGRFLICFSLGVALFVYRDVAPISGWIAASLGALAWIALGTGLERIIAPVAVGYAALWIGNWPLTRLRTITNRMDLSYGTYIFGWPISQTLVHFFPQISPAGIVVSSIFLAGGLAALSWHFVESPALKKRSAIDFWISKVSERARLQRRQA